MAKQRYYKIIISVVILLFVTIILAKVLTGTNRKTVTKSKVVAAKVVKQVLKNRASNTLPPSLRISKNLLKFKAKYGFKSKLKCGRVVKNGFDVASLGGELVKFSDVYMQPYTCVNCIIPAFLADGTSLMLQYSKPNKYTSKNNWWNICGVLTSRHASAAWITVTAIEPQ